MKKRLIIIPWICLLGAGFVFLPSFRALESSLPQSAIPLESYFDLKREALEILDSKCNVCHKKQNPFMVFKEKNMSKRAPKIYQVVFVERRMPKGNEVRLTDEEYSKLKKWLLTQNIF